LFFLFFLLTAFRITPPTTAKDKGSTVRCDPWFAFTTRSVLSYRPSWSTICPAALQNLLTLRRSNLRYPFALRESFFFPQTPGALHLLTGNVSPFLIPKIDQS
jgi:hypothetical protein